MTETKSIWVSRERQRRRQNWSDESGCDGKERVGDGDGDDGDDEESFCVSVVVETRQKVNYFFLFFQFWFNY